MQDRDIDFSSIEQHIRHARIERSIVLANIIATGALALGHAVKRLGRAIVLTIEGARDGRAIEADAFMRRSMSRN